MTITARIPRDKSHQVSRWSPDGARRVVAVKWWAAVGGVALAVQIGLYSTWIASGPVRTPSGPTPVPDWMRISVRGWEIASVVLGLVVLMRFVVGPWRRERRLTLDGMLVIALFLNFWQEPLANYGGYWAVWNTEFVQFGSWLGSVPGGLVHNPSRFAEPVLFAFPGYAWIGLFAAMSLNVAMGRIHRRHPRMGRLGLFGTAWVFAFPALLVAEGLWLRLGLFSFPGGIRWLTLFRGHYYQIALNEIICFSVVLAGWATLRYCTDDRGLTFAEKGSEDVHATPRRRTAMRLLAVIGAVNAIYFVGYNVPHYWFATHADSWPQDVQNRSYLTNGLCGPGTDFDCRGPRLPNPP